MATAQGKVLKIYASKTAAQAIEQGASTPEALSFASDKNQIIFNNHVYGVVQLPDISISDEVTVEQVTTLLGTPTNIGKLKTYIERGVPLLAKINNYITLITLREFSAGAWSLFFTANDKFYDIGLSVNGSNWSIPGQTVKNLSTSIVNNLTTNATGAALSAAQGKVLNDKITNLSTIVGSAYRVKGTKATIGEVIALTDAKIGDVWNVTNEFVLANHKYSGGTNVVCIADTSSSSHTEANWDALGGTIEGMLMPSDVVDNLTTPDPTAVLSANQGKILKDSLNTLQTALTIQ